MHFFYIDEAGCNLRDLTHPESPIFVLGGLVVRDEGWNKTLSEYIRIISNFFGGAIPDGFELHAHQLLSPQGEGVFQNHTREHRCKLAQDVLNLITDRKHHYTLLPIEKSVLSGYEISKIQNKHHVELKTPYLLCYDNIIDTIEQYIQNKLGKSARGMVIIDEKDALKAEIDTLTKFRRFHSVASKKIKLITEFSYAVDSKTNPMIQISDLACFVAKKFYGIEKGYHNNYSPEAKTFFRNLYLLIHDRLINKGFTRETGRNAHHYNNFMEAIVPKPGYGWKNKNY
jgi:hypothetical protein